jgi:S1-C subfamily serine protease
MHEYMKVKNRLHALAGLAAAALVVVAAGAGAASADPPSGGQAATASAGAAAPGTGTPVAADGTGIRLPVAAAKPVAGAVPASVQSFHASVGDVAGAPGVKAFQAGGEEKPRGAREAALFRAWAPAVILVAVSDGLGSGAVIDKEHRLAVTNRHVVGNNTQVSVIFKPQGEADAQDQTAYRAEVVKVDEVADLAVIRISEIPAYVPEIKLGAMTDIEVGSDVHAIGHPTGEAWSYTGGIVSQIRHNYEWDADDGLKHRATVIQTQTPLNPGNSGGPLLDDAGALVGINSFIRAEAEGLNFAVSVDDVRNLLAMQGSRLESPAAAPQAKGQPPGQGKGPGAGNMPPKGKGGAGPCGEERHPVDTDDDGKPDAYGVDEDCDGQMELLLEDSDGDGRIDTVYGDRNGDGQTDFKALDKDGDGELDVFFLDEDGDGNADLVGTDRDGDGEPDGYRKM